MHWLSGWFTKNPVAANLFMVLILIAGYFTATTLRIEGFPAIETNSVSISVIYPGADIEEVDGVTRLVEQALDGMPGLKKTHATSYEGMATIIVEKTNKFDIDRFQNEIKTRIDSIGNLPQNAERPVISREDYTIETLLVQVYGDANDHTLQTTAQRIKEDLLADPRISKIQLFGELTREIRIELNQEKLSSYDISLEEVARAINRSSVAYRTGTLKSLDGTIAVKADKKAYHYEDFINIPVINRPDGSIILMGDVAKVVDGFKDEETFARFQGKPSVGMMIYTTKNGHVIDISKAAHKIIDRIKPSLPVGVDTDIWGDSADYMQARLSLLQSNAWQGLLIVFALLGVFLNLKLAFWVAIGIPISIGGTLVLMGERFLDYSINDITTFGMIVVLGILVDDAVIVGESVFEERAKEKDPVKGTIKGVAKVSTATVFGCLTTIASFYPMLLINNELGKVLAGFSTIVIIALLMSLVESKLILPAHLAGIKLKKSDSLSFPQQIWDKLQKTASQFLQFLNTKCYQPLLKTALKHRYSAIVIIFTIALSIVGMAYQGTVKTVFFPDIPGQIISVSMNMYPGGPVSLTRKNIGLIEKKAEEINQKLMAEQGLDKPPLAMILSVMEGDYAAEFYAELQPEKLRKIETLEFLKLWQKAVGTPEGVEKLTFSGSFDMGGGFVVELSARDDQVLKQAVDEFIQKTRQINGVLEVHDNTASGASQLTLSLRPEARHIGVTTQDLAHQIGNAFGGLEVMRLQRGIDEVKVIVTYEKGKKQYYSDLMEARIRTNNGVWVPLSLVADITSGSAPDSIYRKNKKKVIQVKAKLDRKITGPSKVYDKMESEIIPELTQKYQGLDINGAGELEEMGEIKDGLIKALIVIALLIYSLLAIPLKSYWQPFIIMSVVPFGFAGAVLGHKLTGHPLSILSFFGMLAVMGIVVNDSLVMMTRFNQLREDGLPLYKALVQAGTSRFRAIFLTTVTTVCGLTPIMFETSEQAQYLIPAAISLAFGELLATPVTLMLVPLFILAGDDVRKIADRLWNGPTADRFEKNLL